MADGIWPLARPLGGRTVDATILRRFLDETILDEGIPNPNFFNGRILTAQDLTDEQGANRRQHRQLGQALGAGVAFGLEVNLVAGAEGADGQPPVVRVNPGLAVNRCGQAIALPVGVDLTLTRKPPPLPADAGLFSDCRPPSASVTLLDRSVYLLVASPDSGYSGEQAPRRGFDDGKVAGCGDRFAIEGIRFRTEELKVGTLDRLSPATRNELAALMAKDDAASLSKLRNGLAHVGFGTEELNGVRRDPFAQAVGQSPAVGYGAADAMRAGGQLSDCDVPLALLYWTLHGVRFLDMWAVRRRLTKPAAADRWPVLPDDRGLSEGEAMTRQFLDQIEAIRNDPQENPGTIRAADRFTYLPPAGMVALLDNNFPAGFHPDLFFEGIAHHRPAYIEGARLGTLMRTAFNYPPLDLRGGVMAWVYRVRENADPKAVAAGQPAARPCLVFSSGHMAYMGDPHFDVNRWDFSNWA
jgi:hypothetical protein